MFQFDDPWRIIAMDPFRLCLTFGPLAVYLLVVGIINLSRRPLVTNGARETLALGLAVSGLLFVGPVELFLPVSSAAFFGPYLWLLLAGFYGMSLLLIVLVQRPRINVYNITGEQFHHVLPGLAVTLDSDARFAGDCLLLPNLKVQLHVDRFSPLRSVSLVPAGDRQSFEGWSALERGLATELAKVPVRPSPQGVILIIVSLGMLVVLGQQLVGDPIAVTESMRDMLHLAS